MQVAVPLASIEVTEPTQRTGVVQLSPHPEALEHTRQTVQVNRRTDLSLICINWHVWNI